MALLRKLYRENALVLAPLILEVVLIIGTEVDSNPKSLSLLYQLPVE